MTILGPRNPPLGQQKSVAYPLQKLFIGSAIFLIPTLLFLVLANKVLGNMALTGDIAILQFLRGLSTPLLDTAMIVITNSGGAAVVTLGVSVACAVLYVHGRRRDALFLIISTAGTVILNILFKIFFQRARPDSDVLSQLVVETGYSFPSGHAMISSALALSFILICWHGRYWLIVTIASVMYFLLVGLSRLYLGVHYPSDIIAGWCVSILWVAAIYYVFQRFGRTVESAVGATQASS